MFRPYARKRYSTKCDVQLRFGGTPRARGSSSAVDPGHGRGGVERIVAVVWADVSRLGAALELPGKASAGAAVAVAVFDSQRAAVDGAARIQPAVPLVRGTECGRAGVGADRVQQESRQAVGGRDRGEVLCAGARSGARERSVIGRTFQCGWDAD